LENISSFPKTLFTPMFEPNCHEFASDSSLFWRRFGYLFTLSTPRMAFP
jgi:hypothetical protein